MLGEQHKQYTPQKNTNNTQAIVSKFCKKKKTNHSFVWHI